MGYFLPDLFTTSQNASPPITGAQPFSSVALALGCWATLLGFEQLEKFYLFISVSPFPVYKGLIHVECSITEWVHREHLVQQTASLLSNPTLSLWSVSTPCLSEAPCPDSDLPLAWLPVTWLSDLLESTGEGERGRKKLLWEGSINKKENCMAMDQSLHSLFLPHVKTP